MKILFICQYYTPEPFRHPDFCEELVRRGHEVFVVTGVPNYPMGEIYEGYRRGENRDEILNGVRIHRCYTVGRKTGAINRLLNYYSYAITSTKYVKKVKEKFDVVFVHQLSPVMMANAGIAYKKKYGKKLVLYCLDLWPESLVAGGISRNSIIFKAFHQVSKKIYMQADKILVTSKAFVDYFAREFGITNTEYLPQYAEAIFDPVACKKEPNGNIDLMFAGNLGAAQSVETIIEAARMMQSLTNLRWHIVGDGSEYEKLKIQAEGMNNIFFYGRQSLEKMPKYYAMADAMLVTLSKNPVNSLTLPGKVQTYMAAGKPIIGAIDGETAEIIQEAMCGLCGAADNAEELVMNIKQLINDNKWLTLGSNAHRFYEECFERSKFLDRLGQYIELQDAE